MDYNVASDYELLIEAQAVRARFNAATRCRLYQNDFTPLPTSVLADFIEATFSGYLAPNLSGQWGAPVLDLAGQYEIATPQLTFAHSGGLVSNTVFGFYVTDGTSWVTGRRFGTPINMVAGALSFAMLVRYTTTARSILP